MLDPIVEVPELQEMADESEMQGEKNETEGLHVGLDLIKEDSVLEPSLAKITLRIPGLDSGTSDEDAEIGAETELKSSLHSCRRERRERRLRWIYQMKLRRPGSISAHLQSAQKLIEIRP